MTFKSKKGQEMGEKTKAQTAEPGYIKTFLDGAGKGADKGVDDVKKFVGGGYKEHLGIAALPVGGAGVGAGIAAIETAGVLAAVPVISGSAAVIAGGAVVGAVAGASMVVADIAIGKVALDAIGGGVSAVKEKMRRNKERDASVAEADPQNSPKPKA